MVQSLAKREHRTDQVLPLWVNTQTWCSTLGVTMGGPLNSSPMKCPREVLLIKEVAVALGCDNVRALLAKPLSRAQSEDKDKKR